MILLAAPVAGIFAACGIGVGQPAYIVAGNCIRVLVLRAPSLP